MAQNIADALSSMQLNKMTVSADGRLLVDGKDLVEQLRAAGVELPDSTEKPLNYLQCNVANCGGDKI